jgi:DNA-binding transcriptional ArsR family regulator
MHMGQPETKKTEALPDSFRALADPTRMKIMLMLEGRRRTVNEIVEFFELSQPTISRHLQTLAEAGLVKRERKGQKAFYTINGDALSAVCIGLAACFPCCCVTVTPTLPKSVSGKMKPKKGGAR